MSTNGIPRIESVWPAAAIPGGDVQIRGQGFTQRNGSRPRVRFGEADGSVLLSADNLVIARVPDGAAGGAVRVAAAGGESQPFPVSLGVQIADSLHPVANPVVDHEGNLYVTFSGQRGQKVPVSLYKITSNYVVKPLVADLMNPTGLAIDREGVLYVSCRNDGTIHRVTPDGRASLFVEGMGIATGLAFDAEGFLYCGDRSGTIFKIGPDRSIFVFATLEPSISAYHFVFGPDGDLYATGPTTSSFDRVYRINGAGEVSTFFRGLGRPQGIAFDSKGNLYVAASLGGRRGIVRLTPDAKSDLVLSGTGVVGMALLPTRRAMIATGTSIYSLDWDVAGVPLPH